MAACRTPRAGSICRDYQSHNIVSSTVVKSWTTGLLLRPDEVFSGVLNAPVLEIANDALRVLLQLHHVRVDPVGRPQQVIRVIRRFLADTTDFAFIREPGERQTRFKAEYCEVAD